MNLRSGIWNLASTHGGAGFSRPWGVGEGDQALARQIIAQYVDETFSYVDATSFAVMERRGIRVAYDPQFQQYGFQAVIGPVA